MEKTRQRLRHIHCLETKPPMHSLPIFLLKRKPRLSGRGNGPHQARVWRCMPLPVPSESIAKEFAVAMAEFTLKASMWCVEQRGANSVLMPYRTRKFMCRSSTLPYNIQRASLAEKASWNPPVLRHQTSSKILGENLCAARAAPTSRGTVAVSVAKPVAIPLGQPR